jgi:hypothetical protein
MVRATRTADFGGIDRVLDPSPWQMRWKTSAAVRASFAFALFLRVGRGSCWWGGWVGRTLGLVFGLFFLGFGWGIPGALLTGQLFPRLGGGLGNPRLQFLGIDLLGTRTKEAPFVNGHRVLQVASNIFQLLNLRFQGLLLSFQSLPLSLKSLFFGLPGLPLGLPRLELLAQAPVLLC